MIIEQRQVMLKNGQGCVLRSPKAEDAEELVKFVRATSQETDFLLKCPEESDIPVEQEKFILQYFNEAAREVMILAEVEGKLAGNCNLSQAGKGRLKVRHRCACGVTLYREYWGLGLGSALMELLEEKAADMGYEQMELEVVSKNERAIGLYRKMGFMKTGEIPNAMKFKDGKYVGVDIMIKNLRRV